MSKERCTICGSRVRLMIMKGTGFCCQKCQKTRIRWSEQDGSEVRQKFLAAHERVMSLPARARPTVNMRPPWLRDKP